MKKLIIVESPAKIKTISKFLGNDFKIMSTMGHIKDLPTKEIGIALDKDGLHISYVTLEGKEKTIADICKQARQSDIVFLAPDPDREGEIIAWHIDQEIEKVLKKGAKVHRIAFNEITKPAVLEAIENPSVIDDKKVAAQQARRVLDRWVGYEVSPILWKKLAPGLSAGRVQSVALRIICDREEAIRAFKPEEYWTIEGNFLYEKSPFVALLSAVNAKEADIKNGDEAKKIVEGAQKETYTIASVTDKKRLKNAAAPFMTSSLQQAAYNRLGFSVKKTMQVAQRLYEGIGLQDPTTQVALITYMRTDSLRLSDTAIKQGRTFIQKQYGDKYLPKETLVYSKKSKAKAQDAHEAIRPIDVYITPEIAQRYLPRDEAELYTLIWQRFIACQMKPAEYAQRTVLIQGGIYTFKATGSTLLFDGFLKVYGVDEDDDEDKENILPDVKAKVAVILKKLLPKQHFTQPPARYSEATLVKELEKEGIGRPSTYATILNTIRARSYTTLEKKRFMPTELGMAVTAMLVENLPEVMNLKFTARMEQELDKIANGTLDRDKLLRNFYKEFSKYLKEFVAKYGGKAGGKAMQETDITCPSCNKNKLAIIFGKTGEFLGCTGYPDCSFTSNFKRDEHGTIQLTEAEVPQLLDETCPKCGKQLRMIKGKFGEFVACSGYPDCKYIKQNLAPFACPQDGGDVVQRVWRGGKFWGCSNYPGCKFAIFDQIESTPCPQCKWPFLTTKNGVTQCANKECGYKKS